MQGFQAASQPLVMVKLGRREDRAAAYDRFMSACARYYYSDGEEGLAELDAACQAIHLRSPKPVRSAADKLASYLIALTQPERAGATLFVFEEELAAEHGPISSLDDFRPPTMEQDLEEYYGTEASRKDRKFQALIREFTESARIDVRSWYLGWIPRHHQDFPPWWWRWLVPWPVKNWANRL